MAEREQGRRARGLVERLRTGLTEETRASLIPFVRRVRMSRTTAASCCVVDVTMFKWMT